MKFEQKKLCKAILGAAASLSLLVACGHHKSDRTELRAAHEGPKKISGYSAEAIFHLIEVSGVKPEVVVGQSSTTLRASKITCEFSTLNGSRFCEIGEIGREDLLFVVKADVLEQAGAALDQIGAQVDRHVFGLASYYLKDVSCTSQTIPKSEITCTYELRERKTLSEADAAIVFSSLESAGVKDVKADLQSSGDATTLTAQTIYCIAMPQVQVCGVQTEPTKAEVETTELTQALLGVLTRVSVKSEAPFYEGSDQYEIHGVECSKSSKSGSKFECSFDSGR